MRAGLAWLLLVHCAPGGRARDEPHDDDCACDGPIVAGGENVHFSCGEQFCHEGVTYRCGTDGHAEWLADVCLDDCKVDPSAEGCPCEDGEQVECWTEPAPARPGEGPCRSGRRECAAAAWGPCEGAVLPSAELCDDQDNDCDGTVDDGVRDETGLCLGETTCEERTRWIYVVTDEDELVRFEPDTLALDPIGRIDCAGAPAGFRPFSMAVDRAGFAWVLLLDMEGEAAGQLFRVSVADASCEPTTFEPGQSGFARFGMGFVSDEPGSEAETLFVAGGEELLLDQRLGRVVMDDLSLTALGDLPGSPELTGTGDAELWGFFPDLVPATVARIDRTTAELDQVFELDDVRASDTTAWAFAFWGGRFYVFLETQRDSSSRIYELDPEEGAVDVVVDETDLRIVGAGVSTCAPVDLI